MEKKNYYLFIVCKTHPAGFFKAGDCGVGRTTVGPGIRDCLYGTLYTVPQEVMPVSRPSADSIKRYILTYYLGRSVIK